jgi:hypothetical protein
MAFTATKLVVKAPDQQMLSGSQPKLLRKDQVDGNCLLCDLVRKDLDVEIVHNFHPPVAPRKKRQIKLDGEVPFSASMRRMSWLIAGGYGC